MKLTLQIAVGVVLGILATAGLVFVVAVAIDAALEARLQALMQRSAAPVSGGLL